MKYIIKKIDSGKRLDKFLVGKLKNKTRGQAQKMIASGEVLVLGKMRNRHYALKSGEIVEVKKIVGTQNLAFLPKIKSAFAPPSHKATEGRGKALEGKLRE